MSKGGCMVGNINNIGITRSLSGDMGRYKLAKKKKEGVVGETIGFPTPLPIQN